MKYLDLPCDWKVTSQCKNRASEEILHLVLLFGSYLRVPPRTLTLIQCVASSAVRRTAILVWWPSLETAPRLSSTFHRHHRHHGRRRWRLSPEEPNSTPWYWCWVYTAVVSVRPVPLFPGPIWRQDPWRVSQHNISRVSFLGVVACLPQVSFFLFPLATISLLILIFFRVRGSKHPGARDRSGILKVGLHHDVPAVLDHGQGEQDHAPPHHAAQEVWLCLQVLEVLCLQECISITILRERPWYLFGGRPVHRLLHVVRGEKPAHDCVQIAPGQAQSWNHSK